MIIVLIISQFLQVVFDLYHFNFDRNIERKKCLNSAAFLTNIMTGAL